MFETRRPPEHRPSEQIDPSIVTIPLGEAVRLLARSWIPLATWISRSDPEFWASISQTAITQFSLLSADTRTMQALMLQASDSIAKRFAYHILTCILLVLTSEESFSINEFPTKLRAILPPADECRMVLSMATPARVVGLSLRVHWQKATRLVYRGVLFESILERVQDPEYQELYDVARVATGDSEFVSLLDVPLSTYASFARSYPNQFQSLCKDPESLLRAADTYGDMPLGELLIPEGVALGGGAGSNDTLQGGGALQRKIVTKLFFFMVLTHPFLVSGLAAALTQVPNYGNSSIQIPPSAGLPTSSAAVVPASASASASSYLSTVRAQRVISNPFQVVAEIKRCLTLTPKFSYIPKDEDFASTVARYTADIQQKVLSTYLCLTGAENAEYAAAVDGVRAKLGENEHISVVKSTAEAGAAVRETMGNATVSDKDRQDIFKLPSDEEVCATALDPGACIAFRNRAYTGSLGNATILYHFPKFSFNNGPGFKALEAAKAAGGGSGGVVPFQTTPKPQPTLRFQAIPFTPRQSPSARTLLGALAFSAATFLAPYPPLPASPRIGALVSLTSSGDVGNASNLGLLDLGGNTSARLDLSENTSAGAGFGAPLDTLKLVPLVLSLCSTSLHPFKRWTLGVQSSFKWM